MRAGEGGLHIGERVIPYYHVGDRLPDWGGLGIDLAIDCTRRATTRAGAQAHLDRGAGRVLISAASKSLQDADAVLPGINLDQFAPERHRIISKVTATPAQHGVLVTRPVAGATIGFVLEWEGQRAGALYIIELTARLTTVQIETSE